MRALFDLPASYVPTADERAAPVPAIGAVLWDFSNTLFRMIGVEAWLDRVAVDTGRALDHTAALLAELDVAYARIVADDSWVPYADTGPVLRGLAERGTLMVGDNPARDGGAVAAGLRAYVLASEQRSGERGLGDVLALVDRTPGA